MSAEELLPCPFCGSSPAYAPTDPQNQGDAWSRLACVNNECTAQPIVTIYNDDPDIHKRECREAWNRRAPPAIGQLERLDLTNLDKEQRDRLNAAAARLQAAIWEMNR